MTPKFVIRNEVDFIALAPIVLGFQPEHSLVMITANSFHARVDLPAEADIDDCLNALINPAVRHKVTGVAFLIFDEGEHDKLKAEVIAACVAAGLPIITALQVGDGKYRQFITTEWQPLDLSDHPLTLEAQYHDISPRHRSREELVAYVQPVHAPVSVAVKNEVVRLAVTGLDEVVESLNRENAREAKALWTEALRGCEPGASAVHDIAVLLAFSAWLSGDGALCWVALDYADPESTWHKLLTTALQEALDPAAWERERG